MQLQNLSTAIEKINRKGSNNEESDKSDAEERDKIQISDEVTMIARNKRNYDDDEVIKYYDQGSSEEESEENIRQKLAKKMPQNQIYSNLRGNMKNTKRNYSKIQKQLQKEMKMI